MQSCGSSDGGYFYGASNTRYEVNSKLRDLYDPDAYFCAHSRELVPPHLAIFGRVEKFVLKKGLIMFHTSVHDATLNFDYPREGSFFATNLSHPLRVGLIEKYLLLQNGINPFLTKEIIEYMDIGIESELSENLMVLERHGIFLDYSTAIYEDGEMIEGPEGYEDAKKKLGKVDAKLTINTYILTKDLIVFDFSGDAIENIREIEKIQVDGAVSGYTNNHHISSNLNELRLFKKNPKSYLKLVDTQKITLDMINFLYIDSEDIF